MKDVDDARRPVDITSAVVEPVIPMPEPVEVPSGLHELGEPDATWIYRTSDGAAYGAVMRWDLPGQRKEIRPVVWNGERFVSAGLGTCRPLYNAHLLAAQPLAPALIVEGEKTADAAAQYMPDGWIVTTWSGGTNAWQQSDWSVIGDRRCVIWPDNDVPGIEAARAISNVLSAAGAAHSVITINPSFPEGWDLADALPDSISESMVTKLLSRELKRAQVTENIIALPVAEKRDPDLIKESPYRALGYDHRSCWIMSAETQQAIEFMDSSLMEEKNLLTICRDREWWESTHPGKNGVNWKGAGLEVLGRCRDAGIYNPERIRGRGVWMDKAEDGADRVVLNTGNTLSFKRPGREMTEVKFTTLRSRHIYEMRADMILDVTDYGSTASDEEGRMLREMCSMIRWSSPLYAELLCGWIATAIVCGALDWRPHIWITGNQGSGKSSVVEKIIAVAIAGIGIYPLGATTEAGIRSILKSDARPVIFDESETDKHAEVRRKAVLNLMRQSSSEGRGVIIKGSANHQAHQFSIKSSFLLSSIGSGLKEAADLSRTSVLTVRPRENYAPSEQAQLEANWNRMLDIAAELPPELPQKLLARQVQNIAELKANIKVFKQAVIDLTNSPRIGDQLGTLLAGARSLYSKEVLSLSQCRKYLEKQDLEQFTAVNTQREDLSLLHHICGTMIKVETREGVRDRAIGELLYQAFTPGYESDISPTMCEHTLSRYGLRVETRGDRGVWIGRKVPSLNRIMQTSDYFEGWDDVLLRHPYARKSDIALRYAGVSSRAIWMPLPEWPIFEV